MKKICNNGFIISNVDQKALDHYMLESALIWSQKALASMINKAVKSIMRDYFEIYKSKQTESISADFAFVIPDIVAMEEFKPYKTQVPSTPTVDRKEPISEEIWPDGFDIEDYEDIALRAFYEDPEAMLYYFIENKIHARRKAFVKEHEKGFFDRKEDIPVREDDFINAVCSKPGYNNRVAQEAENIL